MSSAFRRAVSWRRGFGHDSGEQAGMGRPTRTATSRESWYRQDIRSGDDDLEGNVLIDYRGPFAYLTVRF